MDKGSFKSNIAMINYKGKLTSSDSMGFDISNRGFQYGDGIFETIIFRKNQIMFQNEHWERISEGLEVLKMNQPFTKSEFLDKQMELLKVNDLLGDSARIKLYIWRSTGGLYTPNNSQAEYLLTADRTEEKVLQYFSKVGIAREVFLQRTAFSHLKTISALNYVMAGIEKKERDLEELVLLNHDGFIAEASASNIYFFDSRQKIIYTPSLESGCINGVSRRFIFKNVQNLGWNVEEVMWKIDDLRSDLSVFTINVAGANAIQKIEGKEMAVGEAEFKMLNEMFNW